MTIALIDYGAGNLHSVHNALRKAGAQDVVITADADLVRRADRIVLPGVGAFRACRDALVAIPGMVEAMGEAVSSRAVPFLGVCVGMQLLADAGEEFGRHEGLGWIAGTVRLIEPAEPGIKVPHMGWNDLVIDHPHPVLDGIATGDHAYFVHSYAYQVAKPTERLAHVDYAGDITAIIGAGNMVGTQFHPEKSQATGLRLIANFLRWAP
ncbi:MAG TPA: imidazole glycerol phosphate synthase subunit HisH [Gemmobacter sp.]|nr:imidazole glycerol phosphate synthase subunit HisH [Gemmobacter sp.]